MNEKSTQVTTGLVRLSYCQVWTPKALEEGKEPQYSVSLLIPKNDAKSVAAVKDAMKNAIENGRAKVLGKTPEAKIALPLRDGDEEKPDDEAYKGMYFINAKSKKQPTIVDAKVQPILNQDDVYSGCWAKACIDFYPYCYQNMKYGVGCGLKAIQKITDDEPLGGGSVDPNAVFTAEGTEEEW